MEQIERRRNSRTPSDYLIKVSISPASETEKFSGVIDNLSSKGLGLSTFVDISPNTPVEIKIEEKPQKEREDLQEVKGKVCWCLPDSTIIGSYNIGIEELIKVK